MSLMNEVLLSAAVPDIPRPPTVEGSRRATRPCSVPDGPPPRHVRPTHHGILPIITRQVKSIHKEVKSSLVLITSRCSRSCCPGRCLLVGRRLPVDRPSTLGDRPLATNRPPASTPCPAGSHSDPCPVPYPQSSSCNDSNRGHQIPLLQIHRTSTYPSRYTDPLRISIQHTEMFCPYNRRSNRLRQIGPILHIIHRCGL